MRALEDYRAKVRFAKSRKYIDEALAAYNAAAYRSAIIAIWIAVVSDIIDKIQILADEGEAAAVTLRNTLQLAVNNGDKSAMQRFEGHLLESAKNDLHMIGGSDYVDLTRLREDRHLCAHPAYVTDDELFNPGPERVRAHLSNAVDHLLIHGPIVGKKAVEKFTREVGGTSFPANDERLVEYLRASYISRSTPSLRANLTKVACKATLDADLDIDIRWRYTRIIQALYQIIPHELEESLSQVLDRRQDGLTDEDLMRLTRGLCHIPCTWRLLHEGVRHKIVQLLQDVTSIVLVEHQLFGPLPSEPLGEILLGRLSEVSQLKTTRYPDLNDQIRQWPDRRLIPRLIELTKDAQNYYAAEGAIRTLVELVPILTAEDLRLVLAAAGSNDQVYGSVLANRQLAHLRSQTSQIDLQMAAEWDRYDNRNAQTADQDSDGSMSV